MAMCGVCIGLTEAGGSEAWADAEQAIRTPACRGDKDAEGESTNQDQTPPPS